MLCGNTPAATPAVHQACLSCTGYNDVLDDASMGWARYAHSMRVFVFNSGLFYIRSTPAAMDLLNRVVEVVENTGGWDQVHPRPHNSHIRSLGLHQPLALRAHCHLSVALSNPGAMASSC